MLTVPLNVKLFCVFIENFFAGLFIFNIKLCIVCKDYNLYDWMELKIATGIKRYLMAKIPLKVISEV